MKRTICCLLLVGLLLTPPVSVKAFTLPESNPTDSNSYIRWANEAKEKLLADYPDATLIDFLFVGCKAQSMASQSLIYKYWIAKEGREFGVYVNLLVDTRLNKLVHSFTDETEGQVSYGKWRRIAVSAMQKHDPSATILDYRPYGCEAISPTLASQTFKFWVEKNRKRTIVYVTIRYQIDSERVDSVSFADDGGRR